MYVCACMCDALLGKKTIKICMQSQVSRLVLDLKKKIAVGT